MLHCGLLGETLGHSYSPMIHHELGDYDYRLFEVPRERLGSFLTSGSWDGLNVTIPYKKAVVPYCTGLSDAAAKLQSVNTIVRRPDGTLYGDNTDLYGFLYMVRRSGISPAGKKALVLGSGGASVTVKAALEQLGAHVTVISRSGPDNYTNLDRHADGGDVSPQRLRGGGSEAVPLLSGRAGHCIQPRPDSADPTGGGAGDPPCQRAFHAGGAGQTLQRAVLRHAH